MASYKEKMRETVTSVEAYVRFDDDDFDLDGQWGSRLDEAYETDANDDGGGDIRYSATFRATVSLSDLIDEDGAIDVETVRDLGGGEVFVKFTVKS